jgi:hypothetical protein
VAEDRIGALLARLGRATPADAEVIVAEIEQYGTDAIDPLLEMLADPLTGNDGFRVALVLAALRMGAPPLAVGEQILGSTRTLSPLPVMAAELLRHKDVPRSTPAIDATLAAAGRLEPGIASARALAAGGPMAPLVARAILYETRSASQRALAAWTLVEMGDRDEDLREPLTAVFRTRDRSLVALATAALRTLAGED